jgi:hypothetical protein
MDTKFKTGLRYGRFKFIILLLLTFHSQFIFAENRDEINQHRFLSIAQQYADAMITEGRDVYGSKHSPLFASALIRETMKPGKPGDYPDIEGVRVKDRSLTGANLIHDIDLLKILYELSVLTGDNGYAEEADKALEYFFNNCQSASTGLLCWGEHLYWDFFTDECGYSPGYDFHEATYWPFWERSYALAPEVCWRFALGEWDHQINDKTTGDFSRHGKYTEHGTYSGFDFPRYAGQMMERWAIAYNRPENAGKPRREELMAGIKVLFNRMQENMKLSKSGYLIAGRASEGDHINLVWLTNNLELARCLGEVAPTMEPEIAKEMRQFALKQDHDFLNAPHKLDSTGGGFAVTLHAKTGLPRSRSMNKPYTSTWSSGYGYGTHAETANICFDRYEKLKYGHPDLADRYKSLAFLAADKYLDSAPDSSLLLKPAEFSEVMELMLNCYELSGKTNYLERAIFFADQGVKLFLNEANPLPKVTNQHSHYESITGGPSFIYQLLKLDIAINK